MYIDRDFCIFKQGIGKIIHHVLTAIQSKNHRPPGWLSHPIGMKINFSSGSSIECQYL